MAYFPYGGTRYASGTLNTDKLFTGQRLDDTGLYYYNARYYDAAIGRFISADTIVPDFASPQSLNRYSYCYNNPLAYIDATGHWGLSNIKKWCGSRASDVKRAAKVAAEVVTDNIDTIQMAIDVAGLIPVIGEAFDAANAAIYTARGDYVSAGLSLAACVPVAGSAATAAKLAKNTVKAVDKAQALGKVTKAVDAAKTIDVRNIRLAGKVHPRTRVRFDKSGFPDLSKHLYKGGPNDVMIRPTGDRLLDFAAANRAAGYASTPKGFTWHHHQSTGRMQLVDSSIHAQTGHTGGYSLWP